jgi:predicted DNA-binding protein
MSKDKNKKILRRPASKLKPAESSYIKVRVPIKLKKALDKEAKRRGETKSAIVREALEKFLKSA